MATENKLINNKGRGQYEFHIDGYVPKIEYIINKEGNIYLTHTEVPPALSGQGIATDMVEQALADIKEEGLYVVPLCPFVASYIKKNPEWKEIVAQGVNIK